MPEPFYPSDLTDAEWEIVEFMLPILNPEIICLTDKFTPEQCVHHVLDYLYL